LAAAAWGRFVFSLFSAKHRGKPWIAVAVAYAVVLQVLLTSVLVSQNAAALTSPDVEHFGVICFGNGADADDQGKSNHDARHECCILCTGTVGPTVLPQRVEIPFVTYDGERMSYAVAAQTAPISPHPTPRLSQGPPQNT
jgi:Protein of unknown function (DUF2946)